MINQDSVFVDVRGCQAVRFGSPLYNEIANGRTYKQLQSLARDCGASIGLSELQTDEHLVFVIAQFLGKLESVNEGDSQEVSGV